jgi:hypothetical protein
MWPEGLDKLKKKLIYLIRSQTWDLPACVIVPYALPYRLRKLIINKLHGVELLKKFPTLYANQRFITMLTMLYPEQDRSRPYHSINFKIIFPPASGPS